MRRAITILTTLVMLLAVGTLPGTRLRPLLTDSAPTTPSAPGALSRTSTLHAMARKGAEALPGAEVRLFEKVGAETTLVQTRIANGEGTATFADLPHGTYCVIADHAGAGRAAVWLALTEVSRDVTLELGDEAQIDVDVRAEDGTPLVSEVEVLTSSPVPTGAATQATGHVHVAGLPGTRFSVRARAPGYDEVTKRNVAPGDHVQLVLPQMASVAAVVLYRGEPVQGAYVHLASTELWPPRLTETNAEGKVFVHGLKPGPYAFRATKGTRVAPTEIGVNLERGKETVLRLELQDGEMLSVRTVEAGDPDAVVAGAKVVGVEQGVSSFPFEAVTDKKGIARLGPFVPGALSVSASHENFVPKGPIPLLPPFEQNVQIALERAGVVEGRVVDGRGFPIYGAHLRIVGYDVTGLPFEEDPSLLSFRARPVLAPSDRLLPMGELGVMVGPLPPIPGASGPSLLPVEQRGGDATKNTPPWVTASDGTFSLTPASPGRLRVLVKHPEYVDTLSEVFTLAPGGKANVQITLRKGGVIEGTVVDARGRVAEGVDVVLALTNGERSVRTGSDGSFAFAAVLGEAVLSVRSAEDPLSMLTRAAVLVPDVGKVNVKLTIPEQREGVTLRVDDDRGYAIEFAQISATSLDVKEPIRTTAFTDKRGEVTLLGIRGLKARLEVRAPGHAPKLVTLKGTESTVRVALDVGERIEGEVRADRGDALAAAEITVDTEAGVRRVFASDKGEFSMDGLEAGPLQVRVRARGYAPRTERLVVAKERGRAPTRVPRIALEPEASVEGQVVDERGNALPGARVGSAPASAYVLATNTLVGETTTDARGTFRLGELPKGTTTVHAFAPGIGRATSEPLQLASGENRRNVRIVVKAGEGLAPEGEGAPTLALTLGEASDVARVVVVSVTPGGGAERSGLRAGDVIVSVQGTRVSTIPQARHLMSGPISDDVLVEVEREERTLTLRAARDNARK